MTWLGKIAVDILGTVAAVFLSPIACAFADKYTGRLPKVFAWMETPDNRLPGDLNEPTVKAIYDRCGFYLTSVYWLGWRNKAYGLSSRLRFVADRSMPMSFTGNPNVSDDTAERGWCWYRIGPAREFYAVYGKHFGIRIRLGYKLQPYFTSDDWDNPVFGQPVIHLSFRKLA